MHDSRTAFNGFDRKPPFHLVVLLNFTPQFTALFTFASFDRMLQHKNQYKVRFALTAHIFFQRVFILKYEISLFIFVLNYMLTSNTEKEHTRANMSVAFSVCVFVSKSNKEQFINFRSRDKWKLSNAVCFCLYFVECVFFTLLLCFVVDGFWLKIHLYRCLILN